jgi:hypothetical protein
MALRQRLYLSVKVDIPLRTADPLNVKATGHGLLVWSHRNAVKFCLDIYLDMYVSMLNELLSLKLIIMQLVSWVTLKVLMVA